MPFCEVEKGVRLYYETFGSGEPLVFVHGGGISHEFWEQQTYAFADSHQVLAYDLRGHGESDKPPHGHEFNRFVLDLEALIKHLELGKVTLVCYAIGGYVGMLYALRNPNLLSKLVLVSSSARFLEEGRSTSGTTTGTVSRGTRSAQPRDLLTACSITGIRDRKSGKPRLTS